MNNNYPHSVHGIRKKDGVLELIAPDFTVKTVGWWIFTHSYRKAVDPLDKFEAVEIARKAIESKEYQDVYVIRYNGGDPEGNEYYCSVVFENGRWVNYLTGTVYMAGEPRKK